MRHIGSENRIYDEELNELISAIINKLDALGKEPDKYIEYHNTFTIYTTLLLFYASGHRPVIDPFCYLLDIDHENGHVLIDDKTITEKHRYRLTVLPSIACDQVKQFIKHLHWLIYRLKNAGHFELCNAIIKVLDISISKPDQILPFLFLIRNDGKYIDTISISESVLETEIKEMWPITLNQSRHNISSFLRKTLYANTNEGMNLNISNIETHLGHMEQLKHPFGASALQSFEHHKETLSPYLDSMMSDQGWSVIKAKKYGSTHIKNTGNWIHTNLPLGPINRELTRKKQRESDHTTVKDILSKYETEDFYNQKTINNIRDEIVNESTNSAESINRRLNILFRFLSRAIKKNKNVKLPTNYVALTPEPSPFTSKTIPEYDQYKSIQYNFLNYLADNGRNLTRKKEPQVTHSTRTAEIVISAILFDFIREKNALKYLSNSNFDVVHESGLCFVDIYDEEHAFYCRWIPGDISLALLHGFKNDKFTDNQGVEGKQNNINIQMSSILDVIDCNYTPSKDPIDYLIQKSNSYASVVMPGFLNVISSKQINTTHLAQSTILRMIRNERLKSDTSDSLERLNNDSMPQIVNNTKIEYTYYKIKQFIKDLENDLNTVKESTSKNRENVDRIKRNKLVSLLNKRIILLKTYPPITTYVCLWIKKLCLNGTDLYAHMLKFSVIDEYARMIAKPICYLLYEVQHLDLDAEEYEFLYEIALDSKKHADKTKFKNNLADFHNFLVTSKVTDPIDWEPINYLVNSTKIKAKVDANIITPSEYEKALRLIQAQSNKDGKNSEFLLQCGAILILGYRFGLRVSEAVHLEYANIQHDSNFSFLAVHITNNRYKTTKSVAGRRTIPLIGNLSIIEEEILLPVLSKSPSKLEERNIFVDEQRNNRLIDYSLANQIIKQALVLVTGDTTIRFHHLRHSFASRVFVLLLNDNDFFTDEFAYILNKDLYVSNKEINRLLTGRCQPSKRSLSALATLMGHSSISTTFGNYIHVTDMLLYTWSTSVNIVSNLNKKNNTDFITAYCTGAMLNYVKKGRQNNNLQTTDINLTLSYFINPKRFSASFIITEPVPDIHTLLNDITESIRQPDLIDIDSAILLSISGFDTDHNKIASRLFLDTDTVDKILETYKLLSNKSYYDGYFLLDRSDFHTKLAKEGKRVRNYIKHDLNNLSEADDIAIKSLYKGLKIWSSLYHPHGQVTGIVISNPKDFLLYLEFLRYIGITQEDIKTHIPNNLTRSQWYKLTGLKPNQELVINHDSNSPITFKKVGTSKHIHHSFTKKRFGTDYRIQVVLDVTSSHTLKYQKTLDRLCFLFLVYYNIKTVEK